LSKFFAETVRQTSETAASRSDRRVATLGIASRNLGRNTACYLMANCCYSSRAFTRVTLPA
jgi:hypothetical protein